jgi:hypothetical protein
LGGEETSLNEQKSDARGLWKVCGQNLMNALVSVKQTRNGSDTGKLDKLYVPIIGGCR